MHRRLTHSRLDRLERAINPEAALGPACAKCGGPHTESISIVCLGENQELEACEACGRLLHPERGHPLISPVTVVRLGTRTFTR